MGEASYSIIVPCHNESSVIGRKLDNCLTLSFHGMVEILVVDDHSTDNTLDVAAERLRAAQPVPCGRTIRFLKNRHMPGKNGALLTAFEEAQGTLWLITDADILLDSDILDQACKRFEADARLGALCLSPRIWSSNLMTNAHYAGGYETFNRQLKILQSYLDSLPILHGQAMFIRASLKIAPHDNLPADDVDFAFQVRLQGSRVRYAPDLLFYEALSPKGGRVFRQKIRRAKAVMRTFWEYRRILFNPRYEFFGLLCFPLDFGLYFILAPALLVTGLVGVDWLVASYGVLGLATAFGVLVLAGLFTPTRRVALWVVILLVSLGELAMEQGPRLRWMTDRQG